LLLAPEARRDYSGSQREDKFRAYATNVLKKEGLDKEVFEWYLDFTSAMGNRSSLAGLWLGLERTVPRGSWAFSCTRETIPVPRNDAEGESLRLRKIPAFQIPIFGKQASKISFVISKERMRMRNLKRE